MKKLLSIFFTLLSISSFATNRYVCSGGDNTTGLDSAHAWQSIARLNAQMGVLNPGDTVFFHRGETFYGGIIMTRSGSAAQPIVFSSFGLASPNKPIITGLSNVTGWVNLGGNIWEAPVLNVRRDVNLVLRNGAIQQLGRFPNANAANEGYLTMTASTTLSLTGPALSTTTNWTRAEVAVRAYRWEIRNRTVSSHSGGVVSWTLAINPAPNNTYGYFFQRDAKTVDIDGEWYYNDTTQKLRMYFGNNNPGLYQLQIATVDTLFKTLARNNIVISNLAFTGGARASVLFDGGSGLRISNCDSYNNGGEGFSSRFSTNVIIDQCTTTNSLGSGIKAFGSTSGNVFLTVTNNTVRNTALFSGMGQTDISSSRCGIFVRGGDNINCVYNRVTNSGYNAIGSSPIGNNANISYNYLDTFCTKLDDGAGIYVFTVQGNTITNGTNRRFAGNIILNGIGNANGGGTTSPPSANGIYPDEGTRDIVMDSNTVANTSYNSFQGNNNSGITIRNNVVFNLGKSHLATQKLTTAANTTLFGFNVKKNIFYPYRWWFRDQARNLPTDIATVPDLQRWMNGGGMDSNYYLIKPGPVDTSANIQTDSFPRRNAAPGVPGSFLQIYRNFAYVTGTLGFELHSTRELDATGTLEYAAQSTPRVVTFVGLRKRDVYGNFYNNSATILPWYSKVLIPAGAATAQKYYVCATGDNSTGLDSAHAWQTIAKLNANMASINAGDSILFHKGETFYGSVILANSGVAGAPIVISSFGTGAKPIISGFTPIVTWTVVSGNVWQATPLRMLKKNVNIVTIADIPQAVGRSAWFTYQTASPTVINSTALTGQPSFIGSEIVIRANTPYAEKGTVTAQVGTTVTYANNTQPIENNTRRPFITGTANYGYFFQRYNTSLDTQGEWFFDSAANRLRIFTTTNPNTLSIKASSIDTVFVLSNKQYVTITGLKIEGGGVYGIESVAGSNITINNCDFANNTKAVYAYNSDDVRVEDNTFDYSLNGAVLVKNTFAKRSNINRNVVTNTGTLIGNGVFNSPHDLRGIAGVNDSTRSNNYVNILNNYVRNTGASSIEFQGSNVTVRKNITDTMANVIDGNSGIFTTIQNTSLNNIVYSSRIVDSNFVSNGIGAPLGAPVARPVDVAGLDMDDQTNNVTLNHNTVYNIAGDGIRINSANAITITSNISYNNTNGIGLYKRDFGTIRNLSLRRNIFFARTNTQLAMLFNSGTVNDIPLFGTADSNFYARPIDDNLTISTTQPSTGLVMRSLNSWQLFTSQDLNSNKAPKTITTVNDIHFDANPTSSSILLTFSGFSRITIPGVIVNNSYTLPAWTSTIMLDTLAIVPNVPPTANAGVDKTITLPVNSTSVTGSGNDPDGTITAFRWTQISGPNVATIATPNAATTNVTGLIEGTYTLRFRVTDNSGDTAVDFMQITVLPVVIPPNVLPIADAGADQNITLPTSSVTVSGSGSSDPDGTITAYLWTKVSGPTGGAISTPTNVSTNITGLQAGTYVFKLRVTDNRSDTAIDFMQVNVTPANIPPTADAGADQSITLPTSTTTLTGSGTDPDGTITSYAWTKISGPTGGSITSPSSSSTGITALQQGTYVYQLVVTDNDGATASDFVQVVVNAANVAPTADAGVDQEITLPTSSATLEGSGSDPDGTIVSYAWLKISGPSGGTVTSPSSATTGVTALQAGTYVYQLTVTDNGGLTGVDFMQVLVNPEPIVLPTADAGIDQTIQLPVNSANVTGVATMGSGTSVVTTWSLVSGPSTPFITSPNALATSITGMIEGLYTFQFKVVNNLNDSAIDLMQVNVLPIIRPPNVPPTANAGGNQTITLPVNSVNLSGAASTDPDGTITGYLWEQVSGPSTGVFGTANAVTTTFGSLVEGTYLVQLTVTDNNGETGTNTIFITVNAAIPNVPPTADAGADQEITLPTSTVTLTGSGTDPDGTITGYLWTKISGPAGGTITSPTLASTGVTALGAGVYIFQLRVTDNSGDTATDAMQVTVNAANQLPTADAGANQVITLPTNSTTLVGSGTDPDGTITDYLWTKISGPSGGAISSPTTATTGITVLIAGVYVYQLRVTDNSGDTATAAVQITVNAANVPPTVDAGPDQTLTLPVNNTALNGTASDVDGTIAAYLWTKISGPLLGDIVGAESANPQVENLVQGQYIFQLRVTDNVGDTAIDAMQVTVLQAVNTVPTANAGADQAITLPTSTTTLDGSGSTDTDGSISSYLWVQLSGPSSAAITSPSSAITGVTGLQVGTYQFKLTVIDNIGDSGVDVMQVVVSPQLANPIANVGVNKTITLPVNSTTLVGSGTPFGSATIVSYAWTDVSGNPSTGTIQSPSSATTLVSPLAQGIYRYRLTVTDSNGNTGSNVLSVTVNAPLPPNIPVLLRWIPVN